MTAIVMAGGRGQRMKADKARLDVQGRTLLEHVVGQIEPFFDEILISVSPRQKRSPLAALPKRVCGPVGSGVWGGHANIRMVEDEAPDLGPLGGILAGLKAAANEASVVVACDIPDIDVPLLRSLAKAARDAEIAVPAGPAGLFEPLFAVYRRSIVAEIEALILSGERSILPLFDRCRSVVVRFDDPGRIRNLNTPADYESYLRTFSSRPSGAGKAPKPKKRTVTPQRNRIRRKP